MAEVLFYHLERSTLGQVLPGLLERTVARGWSALVKVGDTEKAAALDAHLWTYRDDSFLPHGLGADDAAVPIWLTADATIPQGRDVLFLVDGATAPTADHAQFTRSVLLFDGDGAPAARDAWKDIKAAGIDATYWRQSASGKWEKAA